jgi:hypothetical protein
MKKALSAISSASSTSPRAQISFAAARPPAIGTACERTGKLIAIRFEFVVVEFLVFILVIGEHRIVVVFGIFGVFAVIVIVFQVVSQFTEFVEFVAIGE